MPPRVLIADDDREMLDMVSREAERFGADVVRATSGDELLQAIAEAGPFDVVVTDIAMPWMTGLQVMHSARAAGLRCPVVIMTGLRDPNIPAHVASLGSRAALIYKPFSIEQLYTALRTCLGETGAATQAHSGTT